MSTMQLALQLKVAQTGLENIEALIKELRAAGQDTSAFEQQADALRQTLAELGRKAEAVETFKRLKQATTDAADALRQAQDKAQALGRAYAQLESPTKKQTAELERARRAVREASDAHQASVLALQNHRKAMADMGVSTRNLSGQMAAIKSASAGARQAMAGLETTLKSTVADLKASGDAAQASARGAEAASKAWGGLKSGLAAGAGFAAAQAGINTLSGTLDKLKQGITSIVETGARFETLRTQLETLYGSADKAEQAFAWINDFTASTPFELEQVTQGFIKLKAMGLDPMDGSFQAIADQASALGASGETLNGIVLALGQAWSKQKLQGEEALQLIERGVPVWELLAKATGRNAAELQDMSAKGLLGRDAIKALMDEMGRANAGAATAAMQTFNGQLSNLQDNWTEFQRRIADAGAFEFFKAQIEQVNQAIARMKADGRLDEYAKTVSDAIVSMGEAIKSGAVFVRDYADTLLLLGQVAATLKLIGAAQQMTLFAAEATLAADAAEKTAGRIKSAFAVLNAFLIGQQIGGYLKERFIEVELAGIALAEGLTKMAARARFALEVLNTPINADTFNAIGKAYDRLQAELANIELEYGDIAQAAIDARNKSVQGADATSAALKKAGESGKQAGADVEAGAVGGKAGLEKLGNQAADTAAALKRLRVDPEEITTGLDQATREIIQAFDVVRTAPALDGRVIMASFNNALKDASDRGVPALASSLIRAFDEGRVGAEDVAKGVQAIAARLNEAKAKADAMYQSGQIGAEQYKQKLIELANIAGGVGQQLQNAGQQGAPQLQQVQKDAEGAAGGLQQVSTQLQNVTQSGDQMEQGLGVVIDTTNELTQSTSSAGEILKWMRGEVDAAVGSIAALSDSAGRAVEALKNSGQGFTEWTSQVAKLNAMDFVGNNPMGDLAAEAEILNGKLEETGNVIEDLSRRSMFSPGAWKPWYDGLKSMALFERELVKAKLRMNEFEQAQTKINQEFELGNISLAQQASMLRGVESQFRDLGDENLVGLRQAITDVEDRLKDMGDAARDTLSDLRDEFDEMNGDLDAIEKRRADQRRADLEAKRAEAEAAGNTQAVRDYQEALRLLDQVSKARIKDAAERERQEAAERASKVTPADTSHTKTVNVRITLPNGQTKTVQTVAGSEDALLDALETLGARA